MIERTTPQPIRLAVGGTSFNHIQCPGEQMEVLVIFSYWPSDPYTVRMDVMVEGAPSVQPWEVSRETMSSAFASRGRMIGLGDFQMCVNGERALLRLWNAHARERESFDMWLPSAQVLNFLAHTQRVVPGGTEHQHLDIDAELAALFA
jgi:hypothetical protein